MFQRLSEMGDILASVMDAIPSPIFAVDDDVKILGYNQAASQMVAQAPELVIRRRAGEILHCVHSTETPEGCGRAEFCKDCPVRISVNEAISGSRVVRRRARMELLKEGYTVPIYLLVTTAPFAHQDQTLVMLILEDISELMELKSLLPICTNCKRIRNDQDYWQSLEKYFKEHLDLGFSHGICPDCAKKFYPEFMKD